MEADWTQHIRSPEILIACAGCKQPVGMEDRATTGCIRFFKWSVALQGPEKRISKLVTAFQKGRDSWRTYSVARIFAAQLVALIDEMAIYKFLLHSGDILSTKEALLVSVSQFTSKNPCQGRRILCSCNADTYPQIWVFTPDLVYASSDEVEPHRAMKIFYRTVTDQEGKAEASSDDKVEEYELPAYVIRQIHHDLQISTNILPHSAQHHQGWSIGLLER